MEETALQDQMDLRGGGIWWSEVANMSGWVTPEVELALSQRPPIYVCPSGTSTKPASERPNYSNWDLKPATATYALVAGHRGPLRYGLNACKMKLHNSGLFLYKNAVKVRNQRWTQQDLRVRRDNAGTYGRK